jgi:hypothetical protein
VATSSTGPISPKRTRISLKASSALWNRPPVLTKLRIEGHDASLATKVLASLQANLVQWKAHRDTILRALEHPER